MAIAADGIIPDQASNSGAPTSYPQTADQGQERTVDAPMAGKPEDKRKDQGITDEEKQALMRVRRLYKEKWHTVRRKIIRRVLKAYEFFKGNQFIAFDPENFQWFDPIEAALEGQEDPEDLDLYKFTNNIYQMLTGGFVAALSPEVPKSAFFPDDASDPDDLSTAKDASDVVAIVERKNNIKTLQKQELLLLWLAGCYFSYTRYVVDEDRAGTKKEPVYQDVPQQVAPDRFVCPECGNEEPAAAPSLNLPYCKNCGHQFTESDYYPGETMPMPTQVGEQEVPNGMTAIDLYGPLNVDAAPNAKKISQTPILDLQDEIDIGYLRSMYPDAWDQLKQATVGSSVEGELERVARQHVYSALGGRNNMTGEIMPTLSRCWMTPQSFFVLDDKQLAQKLVARFPKGCKLVSVGDVFLEAQPEKLTDHWRHCSAYDAHEFGLFPPAVGDSAIEVQERINDVANITHEHMDRNASPSLITDEDVIDSKGLNGKPFPPGTITGIKRKGSQAQVPIRDLMFQPTISIDAHIYEYSDKLVFLAQLLSGVTPQIFGGSGDPHIETASGQKQQLNTALGRLGLFWDQIRDEHAERSMLIVKTTVENMGGELRDTIRDDGTEFQNRAVDLDNMRGQIHAHPETDQGFPQTYAEIRDRIERFIELAKDNLYIQAVLEVPTNQKIVAMYTLPANIVIPKDAKRSKVLQVINQLIQDAEQGVPMQQVPNPLVPGQKMNMPTRMPDSDFDSPFEDVVEVVKEWAEENWKLAQTNPQAFENVRAYYRLAVQFATQEQIKQQAAAQMAAGPEGQGQQPPA